VFLVALGSLAAMVVAIRAGKSTKDPVRSVQAASDAARADIADEANKGVQTKAGNLLNNDGGVSEVGRDVERELQQKTARKLEDAEQQALDRERKDRDQRQATRRQQQGLPATLDKNGHPVDPELEQVASEQQNSADGTKKQPLPGYAEGWDPNTEIFVGPADGRPAFRYRPAYLTGSNTITSQEQMKIADAKWLDSMGKASTGASQEANDRISRSFAKAKDYAAEQGRYSSSGNLRVSKNYQVDQALDRTQLPCATAADGTAVREVGPSRAVMTSSRHAARLKKKPGSKR
jgi:hypothetical protein